MDAADFLLIGLGVAIVALVASNANAAGAGSFDSDVYTEQTPDYPYTPTGSVTLDGGVEALFAAIQVAEGSNPSYNNPLDLKIPGWSGPTFGAGICVFSTPQEGINRGKHQLQLIATGQSNVYDYLDTIRTMAAKWTATNQSAWASTVALQLGAQLDPITGATGETVPATTLGDIFGVSNA